MTEDDLYKLLNERTVLNQIEVYHAPLEETVARIFEENLISPLGGSFRFVCSRHPKLRSRYITCSYCGETFRDVIADLENEHPIEIAFNPTPDGGYEISLEYKKEVTIVVG